MAKVEFKDKFQLADAIQVVMSRQTNSALLLDWRTIAEDIIIEVTPFSPDDNSEPQYKAMLNEDDLRVIYKQMNDLRERIQILEGRK